MVEADFQRYYRLDLRHEVQVTGVRRLAALVRGLPPDSALRRDGAAWTQADELAAVAIERAEMWNLQLVAMWAAKGSKLPDAIEITHPDRKPPTPEPRRRATTDPATIRRFFART